MTIKQLDIQLTNESNVQMMKIQKKKIHWVSESQVSLFLKVKKWSRRGLLKEKMRLEKKRRWGWRRREDEVEEEEKMKLECRHLILDIYFQGRK